MKIDSISKQADEVKKKLYRICKCGTGWIIFGILSLVIGICLLVFYAQYIPTEDWKKGLGYTGLAFLLLAIVILTVGIILIVVLCVIMKRYEKQTHFSPTRGNVPDSAYPHQAMESVTPASAPPGEGSPTTVPAPVSAEEIHPQVQPEGRNTGY